MLYKQKITFLEALEFEDFAKSKKKTKKRPEEDRKRPEEARKRPEEAQKRPGKNQKRPRRGQKRPQKARNPEFGEKLLEIQCFMNRK